MPETNWGRKETIIWPPHSPIYTFGAVFLALILTGLFVYLRFAFALSPLEQFYLPLYIKTKAGQYGRWRELRSLKSRTASTVSTW
jgi:hypothetical protein